METWADYSSLLFPWGNLLLLGMVRRQRMGLSSGRGLLLREEETCRTFGELMEWSEEKCWPKLRNLSTQSVFPSIAEFWKWMKWEAKKKKKKEAELKKQRLVLTSSWENKPGDHVRCPIGNSLRLCSRGHVYSSRHPEVGGSLTLQNYSSASKQIHLWLNEGKSINFLSSKKKKKKKANCFIIWNPYVWHSIKYY